MGRHRPAQQRDAHRAGRSLRLARVSPAGHDQRRHGGGRAPVLAAGRDRGRGHGDALERPRATEDRSGRRRADPHQPRAPGRYLGRSGRLARDPRRGRSLRSPWSWRGATSARRRLDRAPPRTADRADRRERRGKDLAASHPRRAGRRGGGVDHGGRNAPSSPEAPGRDLTAPAAGSCRVRVQRPRERQDQGRRGPDCPGAAALQ